jgi:hypothetical protein
VDDSEEEREEREERIVRGRIESFEDEVGSFPFKVSHR